MLLTHLVRLKQQSSLIIAAYDLYFTSIDFLANPSDKAKLEQEIRSADVICVVYAVDQPTSVARIRDFWMPEIQRLGVHVCSFVPR
jgi:hypothetical protein